MSRKYNILLLNEIVKLLEYNKTIPKKHKVNKLIGDFVGYLECHIKSNCLLIWIKNETEKTITLVRTGTHADLF